LNARSGVYMRMRIGPARVLLCVMLAVTKPAAQDPAFDVASIRPSQSTQPATRPEINPMPNGRFTATNATVRSLVLRAYGLVDTQLIGAPPWLNTERYDIDARTAAAPAAGPESLLPLVRALLVERFKLAAHAETRELSAYALTFARRDRQLGPQIRPTQSDCTSASNLTVEEVRAAARDGWPPCGMVYFVSFVTGTASGNVVKMRVRRSGITLAALATALQPSVDRPVVDQTGLEGRFDVEYSFSPQPQTPAADSPFGPEAPMLSVALEEQLGLKLDSRRMQVPVLVIDSIDRPTEN
jgi:uncharacterized protein (TIGR03435 family)